MTTQGGSNNTENQAEIKLKYVSEGYQKHVQELQNLLALIEGMKKDLGSVTLPAIKGLKGALRDAGELANAIQSLNRQGSVAAVKPLREGATPAEKAAHAEALKVQISNTAVRQAQLDVGERTLKTQRQLANEAQNELHRKAFLGELTKEEIKKHEKNIDNLKAISKGLEQSAKAGKAQAPLQKQVTQLIQADVNARKKLAKDQREREAQAARIERNVTIDYAAKATKKGELAPDVLKGFLSGANLDQIKALENQMRVQSLRQGYAETPEITRHLNQIKDTRLRITHGKPLEDPEGLIARIKGFDKTSFKDKGEAAVIVKSLRDEITRQTASGAGRDELVKLQGILAQARSSIAEKFAPPSPYQEAKARDLAAAKVLTKLSDKDIQQSNNRLELAKQLEASKILSHKTNMAFGEQEWKAEQRYQDLLKQRIAAIKAAETEQKRKEKDPIGTQLSDAGKGIRNANVENIIKNRQTAAERAAQKARDDKTKADAFAQGRFNTQEQTKNLKGQELKFAADTLKFALGTGKVAEDQVKSVKEHLDVLQKRVREEGKSNQQNQNLANLAHKYNTIAEIKNLKTKEEAELARRVVTYRMRTQQYDEQGLINQQKILDAAKRQDQLLTSRAKRQDTGVQQEKRLTQLTHLEGDGGASMAIVQAGFMMRSQVLGGLSSIFSGAFDSAVQLDKAFRNLQAISASTNYEMATMKVNLINVAQASKFSAAEVGETAVMLAQAGLSIQEIGASMKGIITLAQATGTDLAKSVDVVTSVLSIFNKSATETDTIVNQLTAALNESKLDINKMALGLQYAGNIASDSGVSFEELTAALGATANAGIRSGSTLGTGLRQMFIDLQKPNEKLTKRLETLGITLDQVSFRSQGLEGVLRNLRNAGFSSADAFETFEVRSAAAFSALSGNLTDFHDLQEELADTNAAFEANNVQMESFAVQLDHLKSNLGIVAAEGLKPILSLLRDMAKGMSHAMENTEEGIGFLKLLTGAFAALTVGATVAWFAKLVWHIGTTTAALMGLGTALKFTAFGWVGLGATIITGLATWAAYNNELDRLNTKLDESKGKYNDLKAALQSKENALTNVDEALKNLVDRYGVLKNDSSQTQAVTKSLQEQFNQFGLELDDVADNKIDNVINKVRDLRSELAKDLRQTIIEEAAAKIKLKNEEKLTAEASLRDSPTFGSRTVFTQAASTDEIQSLLKNPEIHALYSKYLQGSIRTQKTGKIPLNKEFNPDQILLELRNKIAELHNATESRTLTSLVDVLVKDYKNITTIIKTPEELRNVNEKTFKAVKTIDLQEKFNDPKAIGGASEAQIAALNAKINAIGDIKGLSAKERRKRQSAEAKPVLEWFEKNIASAETYIEALPNEFDRETFKNLMAAVQARKGEVRKILVDNDKQFRKEQLDLLTRQIKAAEEDVRFAEEQHKDTSGLINEEKTYVNLENKRKFLNNLRVDKAKIESKDADNATAVMAALKQEIEIEAKRNERERQKKIKAIKDNAKTAADNNLNTAHKADLDAKKAALDKFYSGIKNQEKTLENNQAAERFQATAKTYRPLTTGNMFDQLNTDERKEAQAKANATGVSQEYSVFGQAKGAFSRQAARFDNESLQKKQVQEKLALETAILFDLQQRKQNLGIEEYNKLKAEQITLEAEVTRLKNIAQDARADKHPEDLKLAEEALQRNKDAIDYHREAEERLTQDIETRNNTIENLKDNLQALIDKYDLLDTTMSSGVQSMTSGLSSIFTDWASGVIKNTDDVKEAFRSLGQSVLQSMAKVVSDRIAQQFMGFLLNGLGNFFGGSGEINLGMDAPTQVRVSTGGLITTSGVKHFARGGEVGGTNIGRDSVAALLQPNEYVVQRSAVQALGTDFMQNLNNVTAGSLKQGAANLGGSKPMVQNVMKSSPPVNVYVVSPEQQRQMSQQDVVVALQDDILRGGATKKLIKAVITGEI